MAYLSDEDPQQRALLHSELALLRMDKQDSPLLTVVNKMRRIQSGFKSEADRIEDYNRWLSEYIYLIEHNFLLGLMLSGEFFLIELYLKAWGLTEEEQGVCLSLIDELSERLKNAQVTSLQPLKADITKHATTQGVDALMEFLNHHYEFSKHERMIAVRKEYECVLNQYYQEKRKNNKQALTDIMHICQDVSADAKNSIETRNAFAAVVEKIQDKLHLWEEKDKAHLIETTEVLAAQTNEENQFFDQSVTDLRVLFQDEHLKIYSDKVELIVQEKTQKDQDINDIYLPILERLYREIEELQQEDQVDISKNFEMMIRALKYFPSEILLEHDLILLEQTLLDLQKKQWSFLEFKPEKQRKIIEETLHHLETSINLYKKIPGSEAVIAQFESMKAMFTLRLTEEPQQPLPIMIAVAPNVTIDLSREAPPVQIEHVNAMQAQEPELKVPAEQIPATIIEPMMVEPLVSMPVQDSFQPQEPMLNVPPESVLTSSAEPVNIELDEPVLLSGAESVPSSNSAPEATVTLKDKLKSMQSEAVIFENTLESSREKLKKNVLVVLKNEKKLSGILEEDSFEALMRAVNALKAEDYQKIPASSLHDFIALKDTLEDYDNEVIEDLLESMNNAFPEAFKSGPQPLAL